MTAELMIQLMTNMCRKDDLYKDIKCSFEIRIPLLENVKAGPTGTCTSNRNILRNCSLHFQHLKIFLFLLSPFAMLY